MSPVSDKLASPINLKWLNKSEFPSPIRERISSPRKISPVRLSSPRKISPMRQAIEKSHRSSIASQSPQQRD